MITISQNIILDSIEEDDLASLVENISHISISKNTLTIPFPYTLEDGISFLQNEKKWEKENGVIRNFGIKKEGSVIGGIGLAYNYGIKSHKSEIGYWLSPIYRRQGIMSEVLKIFIAHIQSTTSIRRFEAHVFVENNASFLLLEKLGFIREGLLKKCYYKDERYVDAYLYAYVSSTIS